MYSPRATQLLRARTGIWTQAVSLQSPCSSPGPACLPGLRRGGESPLPFPIKPPVSHKCHLGLEASVALRGLCLLLPQCFGVIPCPVPHSSLAAVVLVGARGSLPESGSFYPCRGAAPKMVG